MNASHIRPYLANAKPGVNKKKERSKSQSMSSRAGLVFPCGRVLRHLKASKHAPRVGKGAAIYLAAVLEYMTAEILELGGTQAIAAKKKRITPRHIMLGVRNDDDLSRLLRDVHFAGSGVVPHIHQSLIVQKNNHVVEENPIQEEEDAESRVDSDVF